MYIAHGHGNYTSHQNQQGGWEAQQQTLLSLNDVKNMVLGFVELDKNRKWSEFIVVYLSNLQVSEDNKEKSQSKESPAAAAEKRKSTTDADSTTSSSSNGGSNSEVAVPPKKKKSMMMNFVKASDS